MFRFLIALLLALLIWLTSISCSVLLVGNTYAKNQDERALLASMHAHFSDLLEKRVLGILDPGESMVDRFKLNLRYNPDLQVLEWDYANPGDCDLNGEVGISDITPIALNYGRFPLDAVGDEQLSLRLIDVDESAEIGMSDITPIALNYQNRIEGYRIYIADSNNGDSDWVLHAEIPFAELAWQSPGMLFYPLDEQLAEAVKLETFVSSDWPGGTGFKVVDAIGPIPPDDGPRPIREFTHPITGQTYEIVDGCIFVAFRVPLTDPRVEQFIVSERLSVYNRWESMATITANLPAETTVEYAVEFWQAENPDFISYVRPITLVYLY
ncbi:MAG: hypothetical protein HRF49_04000 [bacterium]|jgi:hypothetical protein